MSENQSQTSEESVRPSPALRFITKKAKPKAPAITHATDVTTSGMKKNKPKNSAEDKQAITSADRSPAYMDTSRRISREIAKDDNYETFSTDIREDLKRRLDRVVFERKQNKVARHTQVGVLEDIVFWWYATRDTKLGEKQLASNSQSMQRYVKVTSKMRRSLQNMIGETSFVRKRERRKNYHIKDIVEEMVQAWLEIEGE